ncbi:NAD(P)-binding domain-containing protein [Bradyrhizobium sp. USDA 3256]|nr:NAD(P)-binding domain-containing protein [Bradyrhizobium pachyrhizi]
MTGTPSIALVGLGEVGTSFASALLDRGVELKVASRASPRATASAKKLGIDVDEDVARAASTADVVLLTITGDGLRDVVKTIAPVLREQAILADLTAADPPQVIAAAEMLGANRARFVDVAIMGAVSLHGIRTPLLASGEKATDFAEAMNALGFSVSARDGSAVGDASSLKLLRSLFAKGLDALVVESMLAAEALGLRQDLIELLGDFDQRPLRDHIDMYLRTHPPHAGRRLVEMELAETQLKSLGLRSLTTRATIDRYRHTTDLVRQGGAMPGLDAPAALQWLLAAERASTHKNKS